MGFVQLIQKDLEQALAEQQRLVLVQVLRRRIGTMTFAELRELLASPLGKSLGSVKVAEVLTVSAETPAPKTAATRTRTDKTKPTKKSKPATKKPAKRAKTKPVKKKPQAASATPPASATPAAPEAAVQAPPPVGKAGGKQAKKAGKKPARKAGKKPAKKAAGKAASNVNSPPGMSAEQAAEMARYNASVLALVREAGEWVTSSVLHEKSGGSINQLRLALHKLVTSGEIVREGERGNTRYRIAAR